MRWRAASASILTFSAAPRSLALCVVELKTLGVPIWMLLLGLPVEVELDVPIWVEVEPTDVPISVRELVDVLGGVKLGVTDGVLNDVPVGMELGVSVWVLEDVPVRVGLSELVWVLGGVPVEVALGVPVWVEVELVEPVWVPEDVPVEV